MNLILVAFALIVCCAAQVPGGYNTLTTAQAEANTQVQTLIQLGLQQVITLGTPKNIFKSTDFTLTTYNSVAQQVSNGNKYKVDVNFTNSNNEKLRIKFTGLYDTSNSTGSFLALSYLVQYPKISSDITTTTTTTTTGSNSATGSTGFTSVDVTQLDQDPLLNSLLIFGFNTILQNGITNGTIPNSAYIISKVNSISEQAVKDGALYNFNVLAKSADNTTVALAYIVRNQVDSYDYKVQPAA